MSERLANLVQSPQNYVGCICYKGVFDRVLHFKADCFDLWRGDLLPPVWFATFAGFAKVDLFCDLCAWWIVCVSSGLFK